MFQIIPTKIPVRVFIDRDKIILQFIWKEKGTKIAKTILKKKNKLEEINQPDLKASYRVAINQECVQLAEETYRSMEENGELRYRATQIQPKEF